MSTIPKEFSTVQEFVQSAERELAAFRTGGLDPRATAEGRIAEYGATIGYPPEVITWAKEQAAELSALDISSGLARICTLAKLGVQRFPGVAFVSLTVLLECALTWAPVPTAEPTR